MWAFGGGKGGVGKSVVSARAAADLAARGHRVVAVDADLGAANLHILLGVSEPPVGVEDFLEGRISSLREACVETSQPGLRLVSGAGAILRGAHPRPKDKWRLLRAFADLEAEVVLIDLGAGTHYDTLDFFNSAGVGVVVTGPEPTSIQNAYAFIKAALFRRLERAFEEDEVASGLIARAAASAGPDRIASVPDLLQALRSADRLAGEAAASFIEQQRLRLVVNQASPREEQRVLNALRVVCRRYLGLELSHGGTLPFDPALRLAVGQLCALSDLDPQLPFSRGAHKLVSHLLDVPLVSQRPQARAPVPPTPLPPKPSALPEPTQSSASPRTPSVPASPVPPRASRTPVPTPPPATIDRPAGEDVADLFSTPVRPGRALEVEELPIDLPDELRGETRPIPVMVSGDPYASLPDPPLPDAAVEIDSLDVDRAFDSMFGAEEVEDVVADVFAGLADADSAPVAPPGPSARSMEGAGQAVEPSPAPMKPSPTPAVPREAVAAEPTPVAFAPPPQRRKPPEPAGVTRPVAIWSGGKLPGLSDAVMDALANVDAGEVELDDSLDPWAEARLSAEPTGTPVAGEHDVLGLEEDIETPGGRLHVQTADLWPTYSVVRTAVYSAGHLLGLQDHPYETPDLVPQRVRDLHGEIIARLQEGDALDWVELPGF